MSKSTDVARMPLFDVDAPSLFDPENVHELAILRQELAVSSGVALPARSEPQHIELIRADGSDADRIFDQFKVYENRNDWNAGALYIDIIHRGRMRILTSEWPPVVMYCKKDLTESTIVKQFRLHVLRHATNTTLIYGTYRFKQKIAKMWAKDYRCGKLLDTSTNIRETMINLAYWLTAQQHAENTFEIWEELIAEAMTKLEGI